MSRQRRMFAMLASVDMRFADRLCGMATVVKFLQMIKKGRDFVVYSLAVDESSDTTDTVQLALFICGVNSTLKVYRRNTGCEIHARDNSGKRLS